MIKCNKTEIMTGIAALVLTVAAVILFGMSYTTGYYTYGQLNSGLVTALLVGALALEASGMILRAKMPEKIWTSLITFLVTTALVASAVLLIGDRVEGIGTCIVTDYDSGHGGEEAIYMSLAGAILLLAAAVYNIIGSFGDDQTEKGKEKSKAKALCVAITAVLFSLPFSV